MLNDEIIRHHSPVYELVEQCRGSNEGFVLVGIDVLCAVCYRVLIVEVELRHCVFLDDGPPAISLIFEPFKEESQCAHIELEPSPLKVDRCDLRLARLAPCTGQKVLTRLSVLST